ncbi:LIM-type zinc finger-containing protein [Tieghemostelium lacteum]|uniref:LIM-type zinc finger-containing protein n=1 Tax=Tieghemostelium lacteum TaxID=361077 RepID=A0A151ZG18_TIELA|nr:LIM-type zinc finger-containing protein [Tieghemostelium lacteum]|eukprot:KYQ92810.1 LIM-type zinc finger-containing protein [Tieghemostelium lacteum]
MVQIGGTTEKCTACTKAVYLTEKIVVEDKEDKKIFHKLCLKCSTCKITLSLGNYASMNGVFYCKPHFKQLFATKGNYDEGFGKTKHTENWKPSAVIAPTSFIKVEETKVISDKKESTSGAAGRFSGSTDKCAVCSKTVYLTEKTIIEDKEDKKILHKGCLKCTHCQVTLNLSTYASMNGVFYCKPHFKQLFATKGNYDESFGLNKASNEKSWAPVSTGPVSFVPVEKAVDVKNTNTSANPDISKKFSTGGQEKCQACQKSVYLTEKVVLEETDSKKIFHKACLKCTKCQVVLNLGTVVTLDGVIYCKPHFKELYAIKGNLDEGFGKAKHTDKWENNPFPYLEKDANYVPSVDKVENQIQTSTSETDINRFKGIEPSSSRENLQQQKVESDSEDEKQQEDQQKDEPVVQQQEEQEKEEEKQEEKEEQEEKQEEEQEKEEDKQEEQEDN